MDRLSSCPIDILFWNAIFSNVPSQIQSTLKWVLGTLCIILIIMWNNLRHDKSYTIYLPISQGDSLVLARQK